jgi:predicted metal-dependent enzyme (double-stranded beta helix superfamily)
MTAPRELGDVATRVLIDNDRVRIWELDLAPGDSSAVHKHQLDYIIVQLEGDKIAVLPEPDTKGSNTEYLEAGVEPGLVAYLRSGGIETATNVGSTRYREILIELK